MCGSRVVSVPAAITILRALTVTRGAAVDVVEANRIRRGKGSLRGEQLDIVAHQLMASDVKLVMNYPVGPRQQILDRDVLLYGVGCAIKFPGAIAGKLEDCFAQGFRGDRAEIDAAPADTAFLSTIATLLLSLAPWMAARCPAEPEPITKRS